MQIKTTKAPPTWYVPEFGGNRDAVEQFAVLITPMTVAEANAAQDARLRRVKAGANPADIARKIRDDAIIAHVDAVEGIAGEDGTKVSNGAELVKLVGMASDASLSGLLDEIYGAIESQSKLSEGERKN